MPSITKESALEYHHLNGIPGKLYDHSKQTS